MPGASPGFPGNREFRQDISFFSGTCRRIEARAEAKMGTVLKKTKPARKKARKPARPPRRAPAKRSGHASKYTHWLMGVLGMVGGALLLAVFSYRSHEVPALI